MPSEVINIGKVIRTEATARTTRAMANKNQNYKVSKSAIDEMRSYINAMLDTKIGEAIEIINTKKRTVILDRDIITVNSYNR